MLSGLCTHWGISGDYSCLNISPEIVYEDSDGHCYCALHAPKYYVQPKGIYYGDSGSFTKVSVQEKKDSFKKAIETLILAQVKENTIRFDKIYWPENFHNYIDSQDYPDKIFMFIDCSHIHSVSNSKLKALRFFNNKIMSLYVHNVETNEITVSGNTVKGALIRDSLIDLIVFNQVTFTHSVTINNIKPLSDLGVWGRGLYIKEVTFEKIVKINDLNLNLAARDIIVEDSVFLQNLYYKNNVTTGWIRLTRNKFVSAKAYFENINLIKIQLTRDCLEYLSFSDCFFPDRYPEMEKISITHSEEVYRDLKKIAEDKKDYSLVSHWHFLEKEMALMRLKKKGITFLSVFMFLYKFLCGYGEKPSKAFLIFLGYVLIVLLFISVIALSFTGFHKYLDWEIIQTFPYSFADFIPLFKTPTEISLAGLLDETQGLQIIYNLGAAFGRIFSVIQIGLFSMAVRNHLKR